MTDITELAQSLKAAADREMICRDGAETSEIWERTVTPENILALVEALEKAQRRIVELDRKNCELDSLTQRWVVERAENADHIAELESRTVKLPLCVDDLHGIGMVMSADAVVDALTSYGIKVEAE